MTKISFLVLKSSTLHKVFMKIFKISAKLFFKFYGFAFQRLCQNKCGEIELSLPPANLSYFIQSLTFTFHLSFQLYQIDRLRHPTAKQAFQNTATWSRSSLKCATLRSPMTSKLRCDFLHLTPTSTRTTRSFCLWRWCSSNWIFWKSSTLSRPDSASGFTRSTSIITTSRFTIFATAFACRKWCVNLKSLSMLLCRNLF